MKQESNYEEKIDALFNAFHLLMKDYHNRFHKEGGNTGGYIACIQYPCLYFTLDIWPKQNN